MSSPKKIAIGLAAIFFVFALLLTIEHFRGKWGLARWKARMSAKGEPVTIAATIAPLPPADQNGMPALLIAGAQVYNFPTKMFPPISAHPVPGKMIVVTALTKWPTADRMSSNVTWEILWEELKPREDALKSAVKALRYPKFNANSDYYKGWGTLLPHLARLRHLEKTLNAGALYQFREGNFEQGTDYLTAAIRLSAALEDEACSISHVIRMILAREAFEATWQATHVDGLGDAQLKELQDVWARQDFLKQLRRALTMEHVMNSHEYARMRNTDVGPFQWLCLANPPRPWMMIRSPVHVLGEVILRTPEFLRDEIYSPLWKFAWSHQDELRFMKTVERGLGAWDAAIGEQSAVPLQPLGDAEYRDLMDENDSTEQSSLRYILSPRAGRFFPIMKKAFSAQTLRSLAIAGLALRRYELRYGKPAPSLEALVPEFLPEVPRDFMDGKPLKYKPTTNGLTLYSVGADGKDDGGDDAKDLLWPHRATPEEAEQFRPKR